MFDLHFRQRLSGAYGLDELDLVTGHLGRPLEVRTEWRTAGLRGLLGSSWDLGGEIRAAGFADGRVIQGKVSLRPGDSLRYQFAFRNNSGDLCSFLATQPLSLTPLPLPFTVLRGAIENGLGKPVGGALLRFDLRRDLGPLLRSLELRRHEPRLSR